MSKSRTPGLILLVLGGLLLGAGAFVYAGGSRKTSDASRRIGTTAALLDSTRAELRTVSLRYQAFSQSSPAIPDSIRLHEAGPIWRQALDYEKRIYTLEMKERNLNLQLTKLRRQEGAANRRRTATSVPPAAIGAAFLLAGIILLGRSRPRPVAP